LKTRLSIEYGRSSSVRSAYLVAADYYDPGTTCVVLCLGVLDNVDQWVQISARSFAHLFGRDQFLDIIVLDDEQEQMVAAVCKPFYRATI